jgi:hypothetical protein
MHVMAVYKCSTTACDVANGVIFKKYIFSVKFKNYLKKLKIKKLLLLPYPSIRFFLCGDLEVVWVYLVMWPMGPWHGPRVVWPGGQCCA